MIVQAEEPCFRPSIVAPFMAVRKRWSQLSWISKLHAGSEAVMSASVTKSGPRFAVLLDRKSRREADVKI